MRLGAILAGGRSSRFGSDKAVALLDGQPLLAHVADRLAPQVDALVVAGRDWPGLTRVDDRPAPGLGPLGGLLGALEHAVWSGFTEVLAVPCDCPDLPSDLAETLSPGPAYVRTLPVLGLWPAALRVRLQRHLTGDGSRSIRGWATAVGARPVALAAPLANLNTPGALEAFSVWADRQSSR